MTVSTLIDALTAEGIELSFEGDRLRFRAPKGALSTGRRTELTERKREIVALLRERAEGEFRDAPLSFNQRSLWFVHFEAPDSPAYNVGFSARIRSAVDVPALRAALQVLLDRHGSLRSTFPLVDGVPVQRFAGAVPVCLALHDVSGAGTTESQLHARVMADYRRPFDLAGGPVFRASLYSRGPADHVLLLAAHHIAADGWSILQLLDELRAAYRDATGGAADAGARPPATYEQFTRWQESMLLGAEGERQREYWHRVLAAPRTELDLPSDRPRGARRSTRGATWAFDVDQAEAEGIRRVARDEGVTPFVVLLAVFKVLLQRYTGSEDVIVGTPVYGRSRPEFARVVGDFVNTLPIRSRVDPGAPFRDLLRALRQTVLEAMAAQDYPLALIVEQLQPVRDPSRSPLFEVLFVLQRFDELRELEPLVAPVDPEATIDFGGMAIGPYPIDQQEGQFDLTLQVVDLGTRFATQIKYNPDLFDAGTVAAMARHFRVLLRAVVADPGLALGRIPMLEPEEHAELLALAGTVAEPNPTSAPLHERFAAEVRRRPDATAVTCGDRHLTYRELNQRANRLAHRLRAAGVGRGTLVGLHTSRSEDLVVALIAILKAGGAYLPIDRAYPAERVAFMLNDAGAGVVVTERALLAQAAVSGATAICVDDDLSPYPDVDPESCAGPDDLAYVIYTSGSTGTPKGTLVTHRAVDRLFTATDAWYGFGPDDVWTLFHSVAFDFSVWEVWGALLYGGRLVVVPFVVSRAPEAVLALVEREGVTVLNQTPSAFREFLRADLERGAPRPNRLRYVIFGGEALELQSLRPWFARHGDVSPRLVNMYGITETCVHVTYRPITSADLAEGRGSMIGCPIPDLRLHVLDPCGAPVPTGVPGELYVGGPGLAVGYLNRPSLTAARFVPDPFVPGERLYRTGDLARRRAGGDVEYLGRLDQQVKIRGFRIELGEIEAVLAKHPQVGGVAVIARGGRMGDAHLVAYVVPSGAPPEVGELRAHVKRALPDYMVPAAFVFLERLPLTTNGKVDRACLPNPDANEPVASGVFVPPATPTESKIAGVFGEVLGVTAVGADQSFFDSGGHSLLATRALVRLRELFDVEIPLAMLFETPTPQGLGAWIDGALADRQGAVAASATQPPVRWRCLVPAQPRGAKPPLFLVAGYMDAEDTLRILSNMIQHLGPDQPLCGLRPRWLDGESPNYASVAEAADEFLAELKAFQPEGPYYLLGDCVGGVLAVELAQRLLAQGDQVALLVLMDTERPRFYSLALTELLRLGRRARHMADVLRELVAPTSSRKRLIAEILNRKLRRSRLTAHPLSADDRLYLERTAYQRLLKRHRMTPYPGHITLIVADDVYPFVSLLGWNGFAEKGVDVLRTPGTHETFRAQHSREWNELVKRCIDSANAAAAAGPPVLAARGAHGSAPRRWWQRGLLAIGPLAALAPWLAP